MIESTRLRLLAVSALPVMMASAATAQSPALGPADGRDLAAVDMVDQISKDGLRVDYTFLSDPGHKVIARYGILNAQDRRGIPHPSIFVIDKRGIVRWKFIETNYRIRPTNEMILGALARLRDAPEL